MAASPPPEPFLGQLNAWSADADAARPALVGIGVGPGDPELLTLKAVRTLQAADVVVAPVANDSTTGRAEAIVAAVVPDLPFERHPFPMVRDDEARHAAFDASAQRIAAHLDEGRLVAFVTLGDPSVYSTFPSVVSALKHLRPDAVTSCIPGIMAVQALAAATGTVLTDGTETLVVTTALGDDAMVRAALDDPTCAVAVYKVGSRLGEIIGEASARQRAAGAVYGEQMGLPGERIARVPDLSDAETAPYLSTVLIPPTDRRSDGGLR